MNGLDLRSATAVPHLTISPPDIVRRRFAASKGVMGDSLEITRLEPFEYGVVSPFHMLIVSERAEREDGETVVEGGQRSRQREFNRKLSLVPAGSRFYGWQVPRVLSRCTYLYIDPTTPLLDADLRFSEIEIRPRLFFFDSAIWETALKLKSQIGVPSSSGYVEALLLVLAHELVRLHRGELPVRVSRGGLPAWKQKQVTDYIEEHLDEEISLRDLAGVAQLSSFHFARAFKQSFGDPPHRYHMARRMERAKALLKTPERSVTEIGLTLGFAETSSFTTAFRRSVGITPTDYRRGLA
jgi:AraC family transcriptional regulator